MRKSFIVVVFLITSLTTLYAQEGGLPSPHTIFEHSVEVVEVHPIVDNASRHLAIYYEDEWITLRYPLDLTEIAINSLQQPQIFRRPDGTYLLLEKFEDSSFEYHAWLVYPEYESFAPIDPLCSTTRYRVGEPWVYVSVGNNTFLCNWITGETSPPLPNERSTEYTDQRPPELSPDGKYIIASGGSYVPYVGDGYRIYSYEIAAQTFRFIGEFMLHVDQVEVWDWLTPTFFVIAASDMPEWSQRYHYVARVDEEGSLEFALSMLRFHPRSVYDPPGVQVMHEALLDGFNQGPCYIHFYDAQTRRTFEFETGSLCEYGIPIPDGSGDQLFRTVFPNAGVVRYNPTTGQRGDLFIGEVETLGTVAPDGSLALVSLGNNGFVDTDQDPHSAVGYRVEPVEYVVMDLRDGTILGRLPADVQWWSNTVLFNQVQLFSITNEGIQETGLPSELLLTYPDKFLLKTDQNALSTFDPVTGESRQIANIPAGYDSSAELLDNGVIQLIFYDESLEKPSMLFDIRLP